MTIECYYSACPFHSYNDKDANVVDEGPFCYEDKCQVTLAYIKTIEKLRPDQDDIAALEKEYLGDPDKQTGIYHPDHTERRKHTQYQDTDGSLKMLPALVHYSVRYEWRISDDGKTLASTCYFDALGHQDAMKQFFAIYNGTKPLVSLTIKPSRP